MTEPASQAETALQLAQREPQGTHSTANALQLLQSIRMFNASFPDIDSKGVTRKSDVSGIAESNLTPRRRAFERLDRRRQ